MATITIQVPRAAVPAGKVPAPISDPSTKTVPSADAPVSAKSERTNTPVVPSATVILTYSPSVAQPLVASLPLALAIVIVAPTVPSDSIPTANGAPVVVVKL